MTTSLRGANPRLSDEDLWVAAQDGEQGAFDQLYGRYEATALRVASRICGRDAAEDSVQAAFLSVWRSRSTFNPSLGSFRSWVLMTVRNRAIDTLRERRRPIHQVVDDDHHEHADIHLTDIEVARRETVAAVREAVAQLPPAQRQVIELAYFGEYSHSEIASELEVPLGTVKGRNRLAFKKLPRRLDAHRRDFVPAGI